MNEIQEHKDRSKTLKEYIKYTDEMPFISPGEFSYTIAKTTIKTIIPKEIMEDKDCWVTGWNACVKEIKNNAVQWLGTKLADPID